MYWNTNTLTHTWTNTSSAKNSYTTRGKFGRLRERLLRLHGLFSATRFFSPFVIFFILLQAVFFGVDLHVLYPDAIRKDLKPVISSSKPNPIAAGVAGLVWGSLRASVKLRRNPGWFSNSPVHAIGRAALFAAGGAIVLSLIPLTLVEFTRTAKTNQPIGIAPMISYAVVKTAMGVVILHVCPFSFVPALIGWHGTASFSMAEFLLILVLLKVLFSPPSPDETARNIM